MSLLQVTSTPFRLCTVVILPGLASAMADGAVLRCFLIILVHGRMSQAISPGPISHAG